MSIFIGDYFDNCHLADLSSEIVQAAEKKLKVKLPTAYVDLMKIQNGGELKLKKFVHEQLTDGFVVIDYLNGIGTRSGEGILLDSYTKKEWGLSSKLVYLYGDSHTWVALDYRRYKGDNPSVVYIDNDTNEIITLAKDFSEFISRLTVLDEESQHYGKPEEYEQFAREDIEEALLNGWHKYNMTAGLHYFGLLDEDLNWFLSQMLDSIKRMMEVRPFEDTFTIDNYLDIMINIIRKRKIDFKEYAQTEELFTLLTNFPPVLDYKSMIRNKSIKIQRYFTMEQ